MAGRFQNLQFPRGVFATVINTQTNSEVNSAQPPECPSLGRTSVPSLKKYKYRITILNNPKRGKKTITRELHHFDGQFRSIISMKAHLMEDDIPSSIHFDIGYYEKRSTKHWLVTDEDLKLMYTTIKTDEISLWCDADILDDGKSESKRKRKEGGSSSRKEEEDVDEHYRILTEKHGDTYTVPQLRLWARTIHCGTHDSYDTPPRLPMFGPPAKRPKRDSLAESISNAALAITKAVSPNTTVEQQTQSSSISQPEVSISPGKSVDLRMKNFQQLRYIQQLFEDKILSEAEFLEQKANILDALCKLK